MLKSFSLKRFFFELSLFLVALFFVSCEVYHGNGVAVLDYNTTESNETNLTTSSHILKIISSQKVQEIEVLKNRDEILNFKSLKLKSEFNPQEIEKNLLFIKFIDYSNQYLEIEALAVGKTALTITEDFNISIVVK